MYSAPDAHISVMVMSPVVVPGVSVQFSVLNVASERRFIGFRLGSRDVRREDDKMPEIL